MSCCSENERWDHKMILPMWLNVGTEAHERTDESYVLIYTDSFHCEETSP